MVSDVALQKFIELYCKKFGRDIGREEAFKQASKLLRLVELTYRPMTKKEYKQFKEYRKETIDV